MVAINAKESLAAGSGVACTDAACAGAASAAGAAQKSEVLLSLERTKKSFGDNQVLKDITLQVEKGQVVGIIGPSGGGKSTLLRCATMLETLDDGTLSYGDLMVCKNGTYLGKEVLRQAKMRFGLVFQSFNLFPHYTVLKNVMDAPLTVQKRDKAQVEAEAMALLEKMGLSGKENMVPCELSGGQQQRVAIARALMTDPELLLLDEITSALDPMLVGEVLNMVAELKAQGTTILMATHEMSFAHEAADRIVLLRHGVIAENGTPAEVMDESQDPETIEFFSHFRH